MLLFFSFLLLTCTDTISSHTLLVKGLADLSLDLVAPTYDWANPAAAAKGAGANGQLYNGMVLPFVNMSLKGWNWYQGENNLGFHTGNVLDNAGYACMLPTMIANWRRMWSEGKILCLLVL